MPTGNFFDKVGKGLKEIRDDLKEVGKDVATLGKHSQIKEKTRQYRRACSDLQSHYEHNANLRASLHEAFDTLVSEKTKGAELCQNIASNLSDVISSTEINIPQIKQPGKSGSKRLKEMQEGIPEDMLTEFYKKNKVGESLKHHNQVQRFRSTNPDDWYNKSFLGKHSTEIAVGSEIVKMWNASVQAAEECLKEITKEEKKINKALKLVLKENTKLGILNKEIKTHIEELKDKTVLLPALAKELTEYYEKRVKSPSILRRGVQSIRKLFGFSKVSKKEKKKLQALTFAVKKSLNLVIELLKKEHTYE